MNTIETVSNTMATTSSVTYDDIEKYTLNITLMTSATLNLCLLLVVVPKLTLMVIQTCCNKPLKWLSQNYMDLSYIVSDEVVNTILVILALYTCLTAPWPQAYKDTSAQPLSLICLTCINLGRYIFRIGVIVHHELFHKSSAMRLVHHMVAILFLMSVLAYRCNWWYVVIAVFMEMNNVFWSLRRVIKMVNKSYWKTVSFKYTVVQLVGTVIFRLILPFALLLVYCLHSDVRKVKLPPVPIATVWVGCTFYTSYQFYVMYVLMVYLVKKRRSVNTYNQKELNLSKVNLFPGISPTTANPLDDKPTFLNSSSNDRPTFLNSSSKDKPTFLNSPSISPSKDKPLLLNSAKCLPSSPVTVQCNNTTADLEKRLTLVKNNIPSVPKMAGNHLLKHTSNVNSDSAGHNGKTCDKVLICDKDTKT